MSNNEDPRIIQGQRRPQDPVPRRSIRRTRDSPMQSKQYSNSSFSVSHRSEKYNHSFSPDSLPGSCDTTESLISNDSYDSESEYIEEIQNFRSEARSTTNSPNSNFSRNSSWEKSVQDETKSISPRILILLSSLIVFLGIAIYGLYGLQYEKDKVEGTILGIQQRLSDKELELWDHVSSAISEAVNHPGKPGIVILYGSDTVTINCLADLLKSVSASMMKTNDYLDLTPIDFKHDIGEVIVDFREKIKEKKVVVVQDLLSVNPQALQAFHNFCDRENPLVGEVIYIITMIMNDPVGKHNDLAVVEREISRKFSKSIKKDILDPLVTRITDGAVFHVTSGSDYDCHPTQTFTLTGILNWFLKLMKFL